MPTEDEIKTIIELYDNGNGLSHGQIAKKFNYNQSTITRAINKFFKRNGNQETHAHESLHQCKTKNAIEAKATYDRTRRLALNDLWFEKIEAMLIDAEDANTLRALATPYGVAEDKRALLEGTSTQNVNFNISDKSIDERLEALARRRAERRDTADQ